MWRGANLPADIADAIFVSNKEKKNRLKSHLLRTNS